MYGHLPSGNVSKLASLRKEVEFYAMAAEWQPVPKEKQFPAKLRRPFYNQSQRRGGR